MNWIKNNYRRLFQYETLIVSIGNSNFRKLIKFTFFIVLVGQIGNLCANNKFPLFFIYQSAFLGILLLSYYSLFYFEKFWQKFECIFRKNRALAPHERSAVPLGTDHCPVG